MLTKLLVGLFTTITKSANLQTFTELTYYYYYLFNTKTVMDTKVEKPH